MICRALMMCAISLSALRAEPPQIERVDAQPLLLLTDRLVEALDVIGAPLDAPVKARLLALKQEADDAAVTRGVQAALDPRCLVVMEADADGKVRVTPGAARPVLEENGWRTFLVKVVNRAGVRSRLRIDSPNARPIPHGPADEIEERWLAMSVFDGRPLDAQLSGLELEYRILQLHAARGTDATARIEFGIAGLPGQPPPSIKKWTFAKDAAGWRAAHDCTVEARDGALHITATGNDPYLSAPVEAGGGRMILRFWARSDEPGFGQIFWTTKELPTTDGGRQKTFQLAADREQLYEVAFEPKGRLASLRLDPNGAPGHMQIDRMELEYAEGEGFAWHGAPIAFRVTPSTEVRFAVRDADGTPCMAAFEIRDERGRVYPTQTKRVAPDFFFQTQIYRESRETIRLPRGRYTVRCSHGPESVPETRELVVGEEAVKFSYEAKRWIDPAKLGWWSGDHHIHAAGCLHYESPTQGVSPRDMIRHTMGEDLKVGCCLTWGPCFDFQKQFFSGRVDDVSRPPYLLRYDVEVSGFGSHQSGHLNLLNLLDQIPPGGESIQHWPTLGLNTLRWAKKQGAVTGTAHSGAGLTRAVGRTPGEDGPTPPGASRALPNFELPAYDGIGANEFIVDVTHTVPGPDGRPVRAVDFFSTMDTTREVEWNMWYHALNCGLPIVASGETDFPCISGERVGIGRVYVKADAPLRFEQWVENLRLGRSYVSDGTAHLLDFERKDDGSFALKAAAFQPDAPMLSVELIVNGRPVAAGDLKADGELREIVFDRPAISKSSWVAARVFPSTHTNPIEVLVDGKPIRASRASAEWCLAGVDQCWKQKAQTYAEAERADAEAAYEHAREYYRRVADEAAQ